MLGVTYTSLFSILGWYKWSKVEGDSLVWATSLENCPTSVKNFWASWAGHAIGNVVVMNEKYLDKPKYLMHEQKHVDQMMCLGIFQPIIYGLCYLEIRLGCQGSHPYYDNPFEVDARRHAGQIIDIVGMAKKYVESKGK